MKRLLETYYYKFRRLALVNLIYFVITLPLLAESYTLVNRHAYQVAAGEFADLFIGVGILVMPAAFLPQSALSIMVVLSAVSRGAVILGMTRIIVKTIGEGSTAVSEMFFVPNYRRGICIGILESVVVVVALYNIVGNFGQSDGTLAIGVGVSRYVSVLLLAAIWAMRPYLYTMAAVTDLSVLDIVKNSAICVTLKPSAALLSAVFSAVIWLVTLFTLPLMTIILLPFVTTSLSMYVSLGAIYPVVERYVVSNENPPHRRDEADDTKD